MKNKHVILFGATGGIGRNLLWLLLREGYYVTVAVRSIPSARVILRDSIRSKRDSVDFTHVDLREMKSIEEFVHRYKEERTDILVFCSGVRGANITKSSNVEFEVNYVAPIMIAIEFLKKNPEISIINVGSSAAFRVRLNKPSSIFHRSHSKFGGNYSKSKLALILASNCLSKKFPDSRIISVDPGSNRTKMTLGVEAPLILRIAAKFFFSDPSVGAERIMSVISSSEISSGAFLTSKGKIRDMRHYKDFLDYIDLEIANGFPYMPL
jgi:NAD(P)-dependent dehydrogenase (short-subunit alcohol dehydrogenase family)